MSDQENVSKQQAKKEAFFVNFNADNAQFYLRRFRYVGSEESDELALAADCLGQLFWGCLSAPPDR
ncbi:MAG: hypothetical protein JKY67_08655 [Pseudomonadales bacterium]|nr:hypothetical protein [Pseudomonadales bacterium]